MTYVKSAITAVLLCTTSALPSLAQQSGAVVEISVESVLADIVKLDQEISTAEADVARYEGGLLQTLALAHVETLKLTRAILQNRLEAQRGGATIEISVPATTPDPALAGELLEEIAAQISVIARAETEAESSGGLIGALAISRLQTEKLSLATLRATWFQAQYGVMLPVGFPANTPVPTAKPSTASEPDTALPQAPEWADTSHPEIDYTRKIFQQLASEGFVLSGWWGILETKAAVDDSPKVLAINFSAYKDGFQVSNPRLLVQCSEGSASVVVDADDYLLTDVRSDNVQITYRIDEADAVSDSWSKLTSNEGAGLFDRRGQDMIRKLYDSERLFTRIIERDGERHDATFEIGGAQKAFDSVAAACGFSTLDLSIADYRSIQAMLNVAGFEAGTPDGVWGSGSATAMRAYQKKENLPETGAPDRVTLTHMGLEF